TIGHNTMILFVGWVSEAWRLEQLAQRETQQAEYRYIPLFGTAASSPTYKASRLNYKQPIASIQ
ncbi:MAG: hypothetical protein D8H97_44100, partial [Neisseria sp.]